MRERSRRRGGSDWGSLRGSRRHRSEAERFYASLVGEPAPRPVEIVEDVDEAVPNGGKGTFRFAALAVDGADNVEARFNVDASIAAGSRVDIVVYLHGYYALADVAGPTDEVKRRRFLAERARQAALDLVDASGTPTRRDRRPTLALVPLGRNVGDPFWSFRKGLGNAAEFTAFVTAALDWLASVLGKPSGSLSAGRCTLMAHSGGGADMARLLTSGVDPDELVCFDSLYGTHAPVIAWMKRRIAGASASSSGLRVFYTPCGKGAWRWNGKRWLLMTTEVAARMVKHEIDAALGGATGGVALPARYRVERSEVGHDAIPTEFGGALLDSIAASLSKAVPPPSEDVRPACTADDTWPTAGPKRPGGYAPPTESVDEASTSVRVVVVDERQRPVTVGDYEIHQGSRVQRGQLDAQGRASFGAIDPAQPFVFAIRDRVCVIRSGAYFDPDDASIEYGGTWFDWTLVRDDKRPEQAFWPYYEREMDAAITPGLDTFAQHEHITRRPIRLARKAQEIRVRATPVQIRVGPMVRYTDHERATIWVELETPAMIRARCKKADGGAEIVRFAASIRVGGRHYAAVEVDGLVEHALYRYTIDAVPLPATGPIPSSQADLQGAFPKIEDAVAQSLGKQLGQASIDDARWLGFRTLRRRYTTDLKFATGSCRMYPGDKIDERNAGPDMLHGLGDWLRISARDKWPDFLFFGGDQIYSDEIGDEHGETIVDGRFAARVPGPTDPAARARDKLVDGAWAGRFAHRFAPYSDPPTQQFEMVRNGLKKLDDIHARYPDIKGIYLEYPESDPREKLKWRWNLLKGKREISGAKNEAADEREAREAVQLLPKVDALETSSEPFRAHLLHWEAGFDIALRRNPMRNRFLCRNLLLWWIPDFEHQLPAVAERGASTVVRRPDGRGHASACGARHTADFAEYAHFYERAWTTSRSVRAAFAHVPSFMMFDDHEVTDDWNCGVAWARMLHNPKDELGMWPKTLTDALAAYWVYQGWGNKAPSQWPADDPRAAALTAAQRAGIDALPELRRCIHRACFSKAPAADAAQFQTGTSLAWHYRLPFDPPFLVPDCRSRRLMVAADDKLRVIDHEVAAKAPMSRTIDAEQLAWMRKILVDEWKGTVAFIAPSTPLLMQKKVMSLMMRPETAARGWAGALDPVAAIAAVADSRALGIASDQLLQLFRRRKDLEHAIRDRTWRDVWDLVHAMRAAKSPVKTLVLVSGDVHHNYCMTGNLPGAGRPTPEILQITSSGLQTEIRRDWKTNVAETQGALAFDIGKIRLVPGFMAKNGSGSPDLVLYQNAVALVTVTMGTEVGARVVYLSSSAKQYLDGKETHVYRYTSGPAYMSPGYAKVRTAPELAETSVREDDVF